MEIREEQIRLDPRGIRPQMREAEPLSGQVVTILMHNGNSIGFRGKEYCANKEGLIHKVPIEAVEAIQGATWWKDGREPFQLKCDIQDA